MLVMLTAVSAITLSQKPSPCRSEGKASSWQSRVRFLKPVSEQEPQPDQTPSLMSSSAKEEAPAQIMVVLLIMVLIAHLQAWAAARHN